MGQSQVTKVILLDVIGKHLLFNGIVVSCMSEVKLMRNDRGSRVKSENLCWTDMMSSSAGDGIMEALHCFPAFKVLFSGVIKVSFAVHVVFILLETPWCNLSLLWFGDSTQNK